MVQKPRQEYLDDLITRWEKPMLRLCFAYLCDTAVAEDAVRVTFFSTREKTAFLKPMYQGGNQ